MIRTRQWGACVAATAVLGGALLACGRGNEQVRLPVQGTPTAGLVIIDYADAADSFVTVVCDSVTVLDRLQAACSTHGILLSTTSFPYGTLVSGIGHRRNGEGGYWLYRVNGAMVPRAADHCRVAPGDTIRLYFDRR